MGLIPRSGPTLALSTLPVWHALSLATVPLDDACCHIEVELQEQGVALLQTDLSMTPLISEESNLHQSGNPHRDAEDIDSGLVHVMSSKLLQSLAQILDVGRSEHQWQSPVHISPNHSAYLDSLSSVPFQEKAPPALLKKLDGWRHLKAAQSVSWTLAPLKYTFLFGGRISDMVEKGHTDTLVLIVSGLLIFILVISCLAGIVAPVALRMLQPGGARLLEYETPGGPWSAASTRTDLSQECIHDPARMVKQTDAVFPGGTIFLGRASAAIEKAKSTGAPRLSTSSDTVPQVIVPPAPLSPAFTMQHSQTKFSIKASAMVNLASGGSPVEVCGAYNYPVMYLRLLHNAGARQLVVAATPDCSMVEATVSPLPDPWLSRTAEATHASTLFDYRHQAYGTIEHIGSSSLAVNHRGYRYLEVDMNPKQADALAEIRTKAGKQVSLASLRSSAGRSSEILVSVPPGVDGVLAVACTAVGVLVVPSSMTWLQQRVGELPGNVTVLATQ